MKITKEEEESQGKEMEKKKLEDIRSRFLSFYKECLYTEKTDWLRFKNFILKRGTILGYVL